MCMCTGLLGKNVFNCRSQSKKFERRGSKALIPVLRSLCCAAAASLSPSPHLHLFSYSAFF